MSAKSTFAFVIVALALCITINGGWALDGRIHRITFDSAFLSREVFMLAYVPPESICGNAKGMPLSVFLTGFGDVASDVDGTVTKSVFDTLDQAITNKETCCSVLVMPEFDLGPFGGYWYINNPYSRPEDYLLLEVIPQIEEYYGDAISKDPDTRTLLGHSMGGFGAMRHALVYGGQYFGYAVGLNSAILIWTDTNYLQAIRQLIIQEMSVSPLFPDGSNGVCTDNPSGGPYTYFADYNSFITLVTASLSYIFNSDFLGVRSNTPYVLGPYLRSSNCSEYEQLPYYDFFLDTDGNYQQEVVDQIDTDYSPLKYLVAYGQVLQPLVTGRIWMSQGRNDTTVNPVEADSYSGALTQFAIDHTLFTYNGGHSDLVEPVAEAYKTFIKSNACKVAKDAQNNGDGGAASRLSSFLF